jgi:hypothetical protein
MRSAITSSAVQLADAERNIRECEQRIADQQRLIEELELDRQKYGRADWRAMSATSEK